MRFRESRSYNVFLGGLKRFTVAERDENYDVSSGISLGVGFLELFLLCDCANAPIRKGKTLIREL